MNSHYKNTEIKLLKGGTKIIRKVSIKNGKGFKSITKYNKGKKKYTIRKKISESDIQNILNGKFVNGLFNECKICKTLKN